MGGTASGRMGEETATRNQLPLPEPVIYRGFKGKVTAIAPFHMPSGWKIVIGTQSGEVSLMDTNDGTIEEAIYCDEDCRPITSTGVISTSTIFVHIRGHGVVILEWKGVESGDGRSSFSVVDSIPSSHVGFCAAIAVGSSIILPDREKALKVYTRTGDSSSIRDLPLQTSFQPMALCLRGEDHVVGGEDGSVAVYNRDHPAQFALRDKVFSSTPVFALCSFRDCIVAGSSSTEPLRVLDADSLQDKISIPFPQEAQGCGSLAVSTKEGTTPLRFVSGFWDGSVRFYSCSSFAPLLVLPPHNQGRESLNSFVWVPPLPTTTVYTANEDSNLYLYNLKVWK